VLFNTSIIFVRFIFILRCVSRDGAATYEKLFISSHTKAVNFLFSKVTPITTTEILLSEAGELYAVKLSNLVAKGLKYTADDAVLTGMDLDTHLLLVNRVGILHVISLNFPVIEGNTLCYLLEIMGGDVAVEIGVVNFLLQELRMRQLRSEVTVVGEQEHACGITVKTSYRVDTLRAGVLDKVHDSLTLLRVIAGCDIVLRFVQQNIYLLFQCDGLVVELDIIGTEHLGAQFSDDLSVDRDNTGLYELISLSATADTGIGQELVQTYRLIGVVILLLILNALFQAILSIGIVVGRTLLIIWLLVRGVRIIWSITIRFVSLLVTTLTLLIPTLLAGLVTTLLAGLVATLLARLIAALLLPELITTLLLAGLVGPRLSVATIIVGALTILWTSII
jgi:hypothetical protein